MSPGEFSLIAAKPVGWQYLLFARALRREIAGATLLRRQWHSGVVNEAVVDFDATAFLGHVRHHLEEARKTCTVIVALWSGVLAGGLGPACRPDSILAAAREIGAAYRSLLAWKPAVLAVSVPTGAANLRDDFSRMCDPIVVQLEMIAHGHSDRILAAMLEKNRALPSLQLPVLAEVSAERLIASLTVSPK